MMGKTHALGGATALAAVALVTGQAEHYPFWAYGAAAVAALIPDADNHEGSMLNRSTLLPFKILTFPLWWGAPHRGRTHSLLGTIAFGLIALGWLTLLNLLLVANGAKVGVEQTILLPAVLAGYASHLALDLVNIPGMQLLWPIPVRIYFPPWRAHGLMFLGRFATGTLHEASVWVGLTLFGGWFTINQAPGILNASSSDSSLPQLIQGLFHFAVNAVHALLKAFG